MGLRSPQDLLRADRTPATPSVRFQAGKGTQISNDFLVTAGKGLDAAARRKAKIEKEKADFANVMLKNDLDTIRTKAEAELADTKGLETLSEVTNIKDDYLKNINERLDKVSPLYKKSLATQQSMLQSAGKFDRFSIGYTHSESRKVADQAYEARIANEMNDMVDHAGDVGYLSTTGLENVTKSITQNAERTFGDDPNVVLASGETVGEVVDAQVAAGVSESIRKAIQQQVTVNDFGKAHETLTALNDKIVPDDRVKIMKMINTGLKDREDTDSLALSEEAFRLADGDLVMAEKFILARAGDNGKIYRKAIAHIQTKVSIRDKQKSKNEEKLYNDLYKQMIDTGNMNPAQFKALPPEKRNKLVATLNKNKGGEAVVTDQKALTRINTQLDRMTDEQLVKINVNTEFGSTLSAKDRELIEVRKRYAQKQINSQYAHGQKWNTGIYTQIAKDFAPQLNIMEGTEEYSKLKLMVQDRYSQIITENPKITEAEIRRKLIREVNDQALRTEDTSFFGGFFGEKQTVLPLPETLRPERSSAIDSSWVRKIQSARISAGKRPYTEDELSNYAQYLQNNNRSINLANPAP